MTSFLFEYSVFMVNSLVAEVGVGLDRPENDVAFMSDLSAVNRSFDGGADFAR